MEAGVHPLGFGCLKGPLSVSDHREQMSPYLLLQGCIYLHSCHVYGIWSASKPWEYSPSPSVRQTTIARISWVSFNICEVSRLDWRHAWQPWQLIISENQIQNCFSVSDQNHGSCVPIQCCILRPSICLHRQRGVWGGPWGAKTLTGPEAGLGGELPAAPGHTNTVSLLSPSLSLTLSLSQVA